ncbi:hypothetical protein F2Q70_00038551 [Brassica cretica]|uniref:Uncharacterized protein n=1 Tax=Brassica cretica TaxID=69181 RepID=A0A8S9K6U2_BRACR|nr:hypothetical protein F2Q70_00038551 [Brassica cretica]
MFVPEDSFLFFGHRVIELGVVLSRTAPRGRSPGFFRVGPGVISWAFCPDVFPCALLDWSEGFAKSSLLLRTRVVPRGRTALVLDVSREHLLDLLERCGVNFNRGNVCCWSAFNVVVRSVIVTSLLVIEFVG